MIRYLLKNLKLFLLNFIFTFFNYFDFYKNFNYYFNIIENKNY